MTDLRDALARKHAATIYRGARKVGGEPLAWETLSKHDQLSVYALMDPLLPIIAAHEAEVVGSVLDRIDALHYPANRDLDRTPICTQCHGKAGTHPCGCWQDTDLYPICGECGEQDVLYEWADYPCPTRQLTNQIRQEPTNA